MRYAVRTAGEYGLHTSDRSEGADVPKVCRYRYTSDVRVLGRIRLSKDEDDGGTSIERQRESIEQWSKMHGHEVVGWAIDSGVSGSVDPFDAPELGAWLTQSKLELWDALVANVIAGVAEGELEAIRERNLGSQKTVRQLGRWHGGITPYGYASEKRDSGYYLVPVAAERAIIRNEILPRVLAHQSSHSIARHLNEAGVPTRRGGVWLPSVIRELIKSRCLLGEQEHRGRVVVDDDGMPALRAEPILTSDERERAIAALESRTIRVSAKNPNPLGGVVFCYFCEAPMYLQVDKRRGHISYRCARRVDGCRCRAVRSELAAELVEEAFLSAVGGVQRQAKVFVPGRASSQSVADLEAAIAVCRRERDLGLYEGDDESYLARLENLSRKRDELGMLPVSAGFEWKPLGETYGQAWKSLDVEQRRTLLLDSKIRAFIGRGEGNQLHGRLYVPEEIQEHLTANAKKPPP